MKFLSALGLIALGLLISTTCSAALYYGNGLPSGGAIGGGTLTITESAQNIDLRLDRGGTYFNGVLVIYFDSIPNAGVTGTGLLNDMSNTETRYISGVGTSGRSGVNFASGFGADYALVLGVNTMVSGLYSIANGGDGSMTLVHDVSISPVWDQSSAAYFTTRINWGDLGQGSASEHGFRFQSTYMNTFGLRYLESFEHPTSDSVSGYGTIGFTDYNLYGVDPVPEPTNMALAIFGGLAISGTAASRIRKHLAARRT